MGVGHQLHPFGIQKRRGNEKHQLEAPGLSQGGDTTCSARSAPAQVQAKDKKAEQGKGSAGRFRAQTSPRTVEKSSGRWQSPTASPGHPPPRRRRSEHSGEPLMSLKLPRFTCANQKCLLCAKTMPTASSWSSQKPRQCPRSIQGHSRHAAPLCHPPQLGARPLAGRQQKGEEKPSGRETRALEGKARSERASLQRGGAPPGFRAFKPSSRSWHVSRTPKKKSTR